MAATPSPNYNDKQILASDPVFQNRVRSAMMAYCVVVKNEAVTTAFHRERETFSVTAVSQPEIFKVLFANLVATYTDVIADATEAGATPLTEGNVAAQAALVEDAHIDAAVTGVFMNFFRTPAS